MKFKDKVATITGNGQGIEEPFIIMKKSKEERRNGRNKRRTFRKGL